MPKRVRYIFDGDDHTPPSASASSSTTSAGIEIGAHAEITCQTSGSSPFVGMIGLVMGFDKDGDPVIMFDGREAHEVFYKHDVTVRQSGDDFAEIITVEESQ